MKLKAVEDISQLSRTCAGTEKCTRVKRDQMPARKTINQTTELCLSQSPVIYVHNRLLLTVLDASRKSRPKVLGHDLLFGNFAFVFAISILRC